jgi:hypothetical protein
MKFYLENFRAASANWYVHEPAAEIKADEDGRKFIEVDKKQEYWVPADSALGQEIAKVLGA